MQDCATERRDSGANRSLAGVKQVIADERAQAVEIDGDRRCEQADPPHCDIRSLRSGCTVVLGS